MYCDAHTFKYYGHFLLVWLHGDISQRQVVLTGGVGVPAMTIEGYARSLYPLKGHTRLATLV